MPKFKGDNSFENGTGKFGCTTLLLHPMPINWDFSKIKQFVKDHCESEEIKNSSIFVFKESKDSDRVWIQFSSESLCRLAYAKLQEIELNGKRVNIKFEKRKNMGQKQNLDKKSNNNSMNMNMPNNQNNFNDYGVNYTPPPPVPDIAPPAHDTYGLSVGFLTSLGIQPPMRNKVFVANLVLTVGERELQAVMGLAGRVTAVTILRHNGASRGQAAVEFDHPVEAVQAISMLNGQEYYGRPLVVRMYKHEPNLPLPTGLSGVGMGLGPNGEALKAVRTAIEIIPLKHRLENAIKKMTGEIVADDYCATPYGSGVIDNFNSNIPYGPGMPPFGMPSGPMPFMPFPDGPFMPGPMGMPMPRSMPGPNMGMPGPNMGMPGPMPMTMPGPNMPMPVSNMPIPGPNMQMSGSNMPMQSVNMPFADAPKLGPTVGAPDIKTPPFTPNKANHAPKITAKNIPAPQDIPGVSDVTLPKTAPKAKSPPPLPNNAKKLTLSVKTEKMLKGGQESPVESKTVEKKKSKTKETTPPRERPRDSTPKGKMSEFKEKRRRSRSSSSEKEAAKGTTADKGGDLTNDLLKLFDPKKPNLNALQGFMDQVISLSKTMSVLRDIVPKQSSEKSPRQDSDWSPERPSKSSDHSDTRRKDKRTDVESSRLSKTISALRESEPMLPPQEPPRPRGDDWSEPESPEGAAVWTDLEIEPPPSKEPEPKEVPMRDSEWSAKVPARSPEHDARRRDHKRTYIVDDDQEGSRPKVRKTDSLPLITSSDMLTFTNLPPTVSLAALSSKMRAVGELRFAELTGAGRAVVRFQRVRDAERCIKLFHRSKVDGQIIEVTPF